MVERLLLDRVDRAGNEPAVAQRDERAVAVLADADEAIPDVSAENDAMMTAYRASVTGKAVAAPTDEAPTHEATTPRARVRATPRARRLARDAGIDLAKVQEATGSERVTEKDVETWIEENPS